MAVENVAREFNPLVKLQSDDHEEILNVIDQLRSEGVSKYVNLPQLIVCGDQSSGKSSVLEAISGLGFPRGDNVCTRFATELILRRAPDSGVAVSIHPDDDHPEEEKNRIREFKAETLKLDKFEDIVTKAKDHIGIKDGGPRFSKDVLRVEVSGPAQPHLTMVDLPGLYHAADEAQDEEGISFVESLVLSYIKNERSVMLIVISAKSEIALQKVTTFARQVDPKGERTLGVITKPDTLEADSGLEQSFLKLAMNKRVPFTTRLGWHVLRNRKSNERDASSEERRETESDFLSKGVWSNLSRKYVGIDALRPRLSTILKDHIVSQLPGLIDETRQSFKDTEARLQKLGQARQNLADQRRYLLHASQKFTILMGKALDGNYSDPYFLNAMENRGYERRLRAVVQNRLTEFSDAMRARGEQKKIIRGEHDGSLKGNMIAYSVYVEEVRKRMQRSRGRELPGTFNPLIIGDLFYLQSEPWEAIVNECIDILLQGVQEAAMPILQEVLDERSFERLLKHVIHPSLDSLEQALRSKTAELLNPQKSGHPITYNHYFTDCILKAREEHLRRSIAEKLQSFFGQDKVDDPSRQVTVKFSMGGLIDTLGRQTETDMEIFASSEATDCMQAYYKVARKKFVDDFSNLAVERCLLAPLSSLFSPGTTEMLSAEAVKDIAAEDDSSRLERERLELKLATLQRCLDQLHRLDRHNMTVTQKPKAVPRGDADGHLENDARSGEAKAKSPTESKSPSPSPIPSPVEELPARVEVVEVSEELASAQAGNDGFWSFPVSKPPNSALKKKKSHPKAMYYE